MKKTIVFFLLLNLFLSIFSINIYINTFDNSIIINRKVYPIEGSPEKFRGKIKEYFKGINIPNAHIPSNLLILEDGQTIGSKGTIRVPQEVFKNLLELYQKNLIENFIIDYYPIEIYQNKILVRNLTKRTKLVEYLNIFLDEYEIPYLDIYYGEYDITPEVPKIKLTTFTFPDYGFYQVGFEDKGKVLLKTYINGSLSDNYGTLNPGTYTFFISAIDEIGLESSLTEQIIVPKSVRILKNEIYELGSNSRFGTLNFVGNRNFYEITPYIATITNVIVKDTSKPKIKIDFEKLFNGYCAINVNVSDFSAVKSQILLNNKVISNGIVKLKPGKNLLLVYSEDGFGNFTFSFKNIQLFNSLNESLEFFDRKKWINIGGILIKSPYIKTWVNPNKKRWIYESKTNIIEIFP
ncbi:hypothetical protein [Thermosipho atlanticus]|uniref:Uncharacterized protein n=1 Tax=Thermosipho atlanticus DSM 15807 TaxID=1123380 RepID=A0A1M5TII6_9BACT|nr:hypothetical protein [Thermosipho atlanticus]SHH50498.1 hypothetical protein SAMN02745199_1329 [Thermosipho atlanticus DSM 15807]